MTDAAPQKTLKIDFVSDVVCPWCAVGLGGLTRALDTLKDEGVGAEISFQPFELNPQMAPEGENIVEHIGRKYGSTPEQSAANRAMIIERGAEAWDGLASPVTGEAGFEMRMGADSRIWNTFDAHRLLHWAETLGAEAQGRLKRALLKANFTDQRNPSDHKVLAAVAAEAGLDRAEAEDVLASGRYAAEVREREAFYQRAGIHAVPAVIIQDKYLISGGQPAEVFEQALRQIAAEMGKEAAPA